MAKAAVRRVPLTKARINLEALVKRVHLGKEYVILEKDGIPIAGMMDVDEFEDYLGLKDPTVRAGKSRPLDEYLAHIAQSTKEYLAEVTHRKAQKARRRSKV